MPSEWLWLGSPLAASLLLSVMLVPLGKRVLDRGVVFADIAIAQWAALGVLLGGQIEGLRHIEKMLPVISISGLAFALFASALVYLFIRFQAAHREAMIGTLYVAGASLATLSVSHDPHGAQALAATLNGDLLWATNTHLLVLLPIVLSVFVWRKLRAPWQETAFLPLFALAVTVGVEVAGVYVVFATLISTPLVLCHIAGKSVVFATVSSIIAQSVTLFFAAWRDLPVGPSLVLGSVALSVVILLGLGVKRRLAAARQ